MFVQVHACKRHELNSPGRCAAGCLHVYKGVCIHTDLTPKGILPASPAQDFLIPCLNPWAGGCSHPSGLLLLPFQGKRWGNSMSLLGQQKPSPTLLLCTALQHQLEEELSIPLKCQPRPQNCTPSTAWCCRLSSHTSPALLRHLLS